MDFKAMFQSKKSESFDELIAVVEKAIAKRQEILSKIKSEQASLADCEQRIADARADADRQEFEAAQGGGLAVASEGTTRIIEAEQLQAKTFRLRVKGLRDQLDEADSAVSKALAEVERFQQKKKEKIRTDIETEAQNLIQAMVSLYAKALALDSFFKPGNQTNAVAALLSTRVYNPISKTNNFEVGYHREGGDLSVCIAGTGGYMNSPAAAALYKVFSDMKERTNKVLEAAGETT